MTDNKTSITETDNNEDQKEPSDARIILGPLVKYPAVGFVIVSIIITVSREFLHVTPDRFIVLVAKIADMQAHRI